MDETNADIEEVESYEATNEGGVEEGGEEAGEDNFKLGQRDFDETEFDREEKEEEQSLTEKERNLSDGAGRLSEEDEDDTPLTEIDEWRSKSKHVFILSESGKPVYSL